jgi:CNT family concentrative nucleoside transporter
VERLIPVFGLAVMLLFAWSLSAHRRRFPWRIALAGLALQFAFAVVVLKVPDGRRFFDTVGAGFTALLDYVDKGAGFVFGEGDVQTVGGDGTVVKTPAFKVHFVAFKVLSTIIFFSALMSILYHVGIMQLVVNGISWVMRATLGTSGAETLSAAGNIFVGQTEAPLLIRPYLNRMTDSEIMAVMVGGFATIAGGVMAAYISFNVPAVHLLTASVMSAPAALVIAKILQPEVDVPETLGVNQVSPKSEATNVIDAAARGASDGMQLALNVAAMLIAFISLVALADGLLAWGTGRLFLNLGIQQEPWTVTKLLGWISSPFAWLMGIPWKDCQAAGEILGLRIGVNEFVAYLRFDPKMNPKIMELDERTRVILTYALCGFANFGSIGIQIGGLGPIAPDKRATLVKLGLRAMIGGLLACYMTACVASILI